MSGCPDFMIDVEAEQQLLVEHDWVLFQHPFFWYSTPSLLKEWQDLVLQYGWAYGEEGTALEGKVFFNVVTTGGSKSAYGAGCRNCYTVAEFLRPLEQTARLCGMQPLPPYVIFGANQLTREERIKEAEGYGDFLRGIVEERIQVEELKDAEHLHYKDYPDQRN
jgi:glutathione-regulated potassium-efflux system ancillary protein KefG